MLKARCVSKCLFQPCITRTSHSSWHMGGSPLILLNGEKYKKKKKEQTNASMRTVGRERIEKLGVEKGPFLSLKNLC